MGGNTVEVERRRSAEDRVRTQTLSFILFNVTRPYKRPQPSKYSNLYQINMRHNELLTEVESEELISMARIQRHGYHTCLQGAKRVRMQRYGDKNRSSRPGSAEKVTEVSSLLTIVERQNSGDAIPYTNLSLQTTGQLEKCGCYLVTTHIISVLLSATGKVKRGGIGFMHDDIVLGLILFL
jgi:hypothetical protein